MHNNSIETTYCSKFRYPLRKNKITNFIHEIWNLVDADMFFNLYMKYLMSNILVLETILQC